MVILTLLSQMKNVAKQAAKNKKEQEQQTKTTTTTTKSTKNLTPEQKQQAINTFNNIKSQWVAKWSITNAKQWAETQAEKSFYNRSTDKEINAYKTMISEWYTPAEARKAIDTVTTQKRTVTYTRPKQEKTVDTWTDKQQNAYDTLVSEWYSEKEAKKAVQKAIQKDWDTWKKARVATKAFWQWVSDVWQRTVGRAVWYGTDKMESKLDQRYENNEKFRNGVDRVAWKLKKGLNAIWVTDADIQEFQKSEAIRKEQGIPSTYWSILSDEEASSRVWTVGRKSWQIAWTTALSMAAWWVAWWWAKALWTAAWSRVVWWLAWTVLWAWEWALSADLYARWLEDRAATKQERTIWAVAGWVLGWIWGYRATAKALNENKQLAGLVQDTSKAWKERAIAEWRTTTKRWLFSTTQEQQLSKQEKEAIDIINKQKLWNSKNPQTLYNNVKKEIAKTAWEMSDDMKNIKVKDWSKQWVKDALQDLKDSPETRNSVKKNINNLIKRLDTVDNADDLWNIRQDYDKLFTPWQKAWYGKWWTTEAMYDAWQEWRRILNDAMQKAWEDAGSQTVRNWMRRLSTLITAENNISNNLLKTVWKDSKTRLWRNRKAIGWWAIWLWVGKKALNKVSWNSEWWYVEE